MVTGLLTGTGSVATRTAAARRGATIPCPTRWRRRSASTSCSRAAPTSAMTRSGRGTKAASRRVWITTSRRALRGTGWGGGAHLGLLTRRPPDPERRWNAARLCRPVELAKSASSRDEDDRQRGLRHALADVRRWHSHRGRVRHGQDGTRLRSRQGPRHDRHQLRLPQSVCAARLAGLPTEAARYVQLRYRAVGVNTASGRYVVYPSQEIVGKEGSAIACSDLGRWGVACGDPRHAQAAEHRRGERPRPRNGGRVR